MMSKFSFVTSAMMIAFAPSLANLKHPKAPIPLAPPVTKIVFPSTLPLIINHSSLGT